MDETLLRDQLESLKIEYSKIERKLLEVKGAIKVIQHLIKQSGVEVIKDG